MYAFQSKSQGFLGWRNKALLIKWVWRFGTSQDDLWRKVVCGKYGWDYRCRVLHLLIDRVDGCSIVMQDILKSVLEDTLIDKHFREQLLCKVGSGSSVRFWLNPWLNTNPLFLLFPHMFSLALDKTAMIGKCCITRHCYCTTCICVFWTQRIFLKGYVKILKELCLGCAPFSSCNIA